MDDEPWVVQARREAGACPCGAHEALPGVYGMPVYSDVERLDGQVVFAGCVIPSEPARWACGRCGETWGRRGDVLDQQ
jgi:hypothetical protein